MEWGSVATLVQVGGTVAVGDDPSPNVGTGVRTGGRVAAASGVPLSVAVFPWQATSKTNRPTNQPQRRITIQTPPLAYQETRFRGETWFLYLTVTPHANNHDPHFAASADQNRSDRGAIWPYRHYRPAEYHLLVSRCNAHQG